MLPTANFSATQSSSRPLPLLTKDAVATLPRLQQFSAVRQLTRDLQQREPAIQNDSNRLQVKLAHPKKIVHAELYINRT